MCLDVPSHAFEHNCGGPDLQRNLKKDFFKFLFIYLNFWLFWVFMAMSKISLVADSRGYS